MDKNAFADVAATTNKYQIRIGRYVIEEDISQSILGDDEYLVNKEAKIQVKVPQVVIWEYCDKENLSKLMSLKCSSEIRKFIDSNLPKTHPQGLTRILFQELIYSVAKFCRTFNFNLEQSGAVLSHFYLTHIYFTSASNIGPQKVYDYFKTLLLYHCLPFPPDNVKLFGLEETRKIIVKFCQIYLRNMPLIRVLSLPNFTLKASYKLEPEIDFGKKKKGKDGKKKKKKK